MPATARPTQAHSHASAPACAKPKLYNPRHPERTLLYQTVAEYFETWHELASAGQFDGQGDHHTPKPYVRQAFRKYLGCGIFAHGFARAWWRPRRTSRTTSSPACRCASGCCLCPSGCVTSCNATGAVLNLVLRVFLRVIAQSLQSNSPGAAQLDKGALHIGAVAFIHRFGSSLNEHVHFHVCAVDGVFDEVAGDVVADVQATAPSVIFHPASAIDAYAVAQVQATLQKRILRAFVTRGLLESCDAKEMLAYQHSGFSVDAGVCIEAHDRAALERLLRYCARPPFAMERLRKEGAALVYRCAKQRSEPTSDKRDAKVDELHLTPLELIDRIAALVPPPRTHRLRYLGVLAPNSLLRAAVVAMAVAAPAHAPPAAAAQVGEAVPGNAVLLMPESLAPKRPAHYLWAELIARIYEVFPLLCPICGGQMRIIAFITHSADIRRILNHIGVVSEPPHISPARGPPLWEDCDAQMDDGVHIEPDWDLAAQPAPDYCADQRISW